MRDMNKPLRFSGRNIPINIVAKIMGKDPKFIRSAMANDKLPIGAAFMKEGSSQYDYYVSPKLLYEFTGFYFDDDILDEDNV